MSFPTEVLSTWPLRGYRRDSRYQEWRGDVRERIYLAAVALGYKKFGAGVCEPGLR